MGHMFRNGLHERVKKKHKLTGRRHLLPVRKDSVWGDGCWSALVSSGWIASGQWWSWTVWMDWRCPRDGQIEKHNIRLHVCTNLYVCMSAGTEDTDVHRTRTHVRAALTIKLSIWMGVVIKMSLSALHLDWKQSHGNPNDHYAVV